MHEFASFNHRIFPANDIKIKAISSAALYGKGIFTTLGIFNFRPFLWKKHWLRLNSNAHSIALDLSEYGEESVSRSVNELISKNKIGNARCRITFFDESASRIWQRGNQRSRTSLLIQTADLRKAKQNISLTISPFPVNSKSPLAGIKSCNYLEPIFALEDAGLRGFDEAVRLNENGKICSASMANIFWIKGKRIFTPSLKTGCLAGTMREYILESREVSEVEAGLKALQDADRIFLTSSGIGIVQAGIFQEKSFSRQLHELTQIISHPQINSDNYE